jgi:hypothetical protein
MKDGSDACIHCGSTSVQEARRIGEEITFRCLHCWKTFTRFVAVSIPVNRGDDAA